MHESPQLKMSCEKFNGEQRAVVQDEGVGGVEGGEEGEVIRLDCYVSGYKFDCYRFEIIRQMDGLINSEFSIKITINSFLYLKKNKMETERNRLTVQLQQAQQKITRLQQINKQLSQTILSSELPQYKQLLSRLTQHQQTSSQTITSLHIKISQLQTQLSFQKQRSSSTISELQQKLQTSQTLVTHLKHSLQTVTHQNGILKKQLHGHKVMIKNQERLIDDYRRSMEEEKEIEREIGRCEVREIENRLRKDMELRVQQIKEKYERKLGKINKENIATDYKKEINHLKQFITAKKTLINQQHLQSNQGVNLNQVKSFTNKKPTLTQHKTQNKQKIISSNKLNHHILIFDQSQSSSHRHTKEQQKQNSHQISNHWSDKKYGQLFSGIKSLGSTLESGIHNFKSIQLNQGRKWENANQFESIRLNK